MTVATKLFLAGLCWLALVAVQSRASEPTGEPEPISQTRPAVDGVNAKLSFESGPTFGGGEVYGASGSATIPLGHQFGLQLDGVVGTVDGNAIDGVRVYAGAAHLFWRDPSKGLIGAYASAIHADVFDGLNVHRGGVEGAIYSGRLTVEGIIGIFHADFGDTEFFADAELGYYPDDNFRLSIGYGLVADDHVFKLGGEWAFAGQAGTAASAFVDGYVNADGDGLAIAGLRFYFGQNDKTLIRRHREDDPQSARLGAVNFHFSRNQTYGDNCDACSDAYSSTH
ncbi:MAG: hypothetical protein AAGD43_14475 [Pseudomonadota bacterium]